MASLILLQARARFWLRPSPSLTLVAIRLRKRAPLKASLRQQLPLCGLAAMAEAQTTGTAFTAAAHGIPVSSARHRLCNLKTASMLIRNRMETSQPSAATISGNHCSSREQVWRSREPILGYTKQVDSLTGIPCRVDSLAFRITTLREARTLKRTTSRSTLAGSSTTTVHRTLIG